MSYSYSVFQVSFEGHHRKEVSDYNGPSCVLQLNQVPSISFKNMLVARYCILLMMRTFFLILQSSVYHMFCSTFICFFFHMDFNNIASCIHIFLFERLFIEPFCLITYSLFDLRRFKSLSKCFSCIVCN